MKLNIKWLSGLMLLAPFFAVSQQPIKDSTATKDTFSFSKDTTIVDTVAVKKNCYSEWQDAFRLRGAKPVTDGVQQVVIALKNEEGSHCFMGQVEVSGGKIKPPLYFQQENGEYRAVSIVGKKIEPAFAGTMSSDELYAIKDGMSIVFRTTDQEYGRLFFYKFINSSASRNKEALSPADLIKD